MLWRKLTWSSGCRCWYSPFRCPSSSSARLQITSLAFMLLEVPAPPWITSTTNSVEQLALAHLFAGEADGMRAALVQQAELGVGDRRRLLDAGQRHHEFRVDRDRRAGDREILQRAQVCTP